MPGVCLGNKTEIGGIHLERADEEAPELLAANRHIKGSGIKLPRISEGF